VKRARPDGRARFFVRLPGIAVCHWRGQTGDTAIAANSHAEGDAMAFDDITKKAQDFLADNKVQDALNSQQAEDISDKLLDGVADAASKVTGGKFDEQIDGAKSAADDAVGTEK
jgi:predicted metal-dependent phosphotriesterase family hydrolase